MLILIDPNSGIPTYRQIVEQVRFQIASGQLAGGTELPSTRALAQQLGINPMTVSKAFGLLEADGLLVHRPGLALTVAELSPELTDAERVAQLRALFEPVALAARQLRLSTTRATQVFRDVLLEIQDREDRRE